MYKQKHFSLCRITLLQRDRSAVIEVDNGDVSVMLSFAMMGGKSNDCLILPVRQAAGDNPKDSSP